MREGEKKARILGCRGAAEIAQLTLKRNYSIVLENEAILTVCEATRYKLLHNWSL